jgi:hypothetical protein
MTDGNVMRMQKNIDVAICAIDIGFGQKLLAGMVYTDGGFWLNTSNISSMQDVLSSKNT